MGNTLCGNSAETAADDGATPRNSWQPTPGKIAETAARPGFSALMPDPQAVRMFPSMLPVGHLTGDPDPANRWMLYAWQHDSGAKLYIWRAPSPEGPWAPHPMSPRPAPTPFPAGYTASHFSSGDIVWDPIGERLVGTPHSKKGVEQPSFLIQSTDGVNWTWLDGDNAVRLPTEPGPLDVNHTGYGRLLRDLDGHLVKFRDPATPSDPTTYYWWVYKEQSGCTANPGCSTKTPMLAKTPSLNAYPWIKWGPAHDLVGGNVHFHEASFLKADGRIWLEYTENSTATQEYLLDSPQGDPFSFSNRTPIAMPIGTSPFFHGGNIIRDPQSGQQYMAQTVVKSALDGSSEIWVLRAIFPL
jgi:hypothetical protein